MRKFWSETPSYRKALSFCLPRGQKFPVGDGQMEIFKVEKATLSSVDDLKAYHAHIRPFVLQRLEEFRETWERGDEAIFEELVFCILTAGASALMGLRGVEALRPVLWSATAEEIAERIHFHLYPGARAQYIVAAREIVRNELGGRLKSWIESWRGRDTRRDACVQKFKGIGYKEASHFLRNIGFRGYAILDKHILRSLHAFGVIDSDRPPSTRNRYLAIEQRYLAFANQVGIDPDELDLTLWASRTGMIVK
jgi:N-glycosylase/DNA lyase